MAEIGVAECFGEVEAWKDEDAVDCLKSCSFDDFGYDSYDSDAATDNCSEDLQNLPQRACLLFDVLGTEDTWQGKQFSVFTLNGDTRGMLILMRWPMAAVLKHLNLRELCMLASTCRGMRQSATRVIEEQAQALLARYFQESNLSRFLDAFACFDWAMSLNGYLTPATLSSWRPEELDAKFDFHMACTQIEAVSLLQGLQPAAMQRWRVEGRKALDKFVSDCVVRKPSLLKMLRHYDSAWATVRSIIEENARLVLAAMFDNSTVCLRRIQASWPEVTVDADISLSSKHRFPQDMRSWSTLEVYQWFRLKKMPVRGVLDVQPTGADLLQWVALENPVNSISKLLTAPPHGLGFTLQQRNRCVMLVHRYGRSKDSAAAQPCKTRAHTFTFRFGEPKDGLHAGTARRAGSAAAAPPAGSTPCHSWS